MKCLFEINRKTSASRRRFPAIQALFIAGFLLSTSFFSCTQDVGQADITAFNAALQGKWLSNEISTYPSGGSHQYGKDFQSTNSCAFFDRLYTFSPYSDAVSETFIYSIQGGKKNEDGLTTFDIDFSVSHGGVHYYLSRAAIKDGLLYLTINPEDYVDDPTDGVVTDPPESMRPVLDLSAWYVKQ